MTLDGEWARKYLCSCHMLTINRVAGISFLGSPLRINRPHDYVPPATDIIAGIPGLAAAGTGMALSPAVNLGALMQLTKKTRRVHVGNLPVGLGLTPAVLKQFVSQLMQQLHLTVKPGDPVVDSFVSSDGGPPEPTKIMGAVPCECPCEP